MLKDQLRAFTVRRAFQEALNVSHIEARTDIFCIRVSISVHIFEQQCLVGGFSVLSHASTCFCFMHVQPASLAWLRYARHLSAWLEWLTLHIRHGWFRSNDTHLMSTPLYPISTSTCPSMALCTCFSLSFSSKVLLCSTPLRSENTAFVHSYTSLLLSSRRRRGRWSQHVCRYF